jgi:tetraacyldisaccharide 4'-kinase
MRRAWYARVPTRARALGRPVISVGNLVVGGSGKTPVVATIARLLLEHGERPSILSRGYGRRIQDDGAVVISTPDRLIEPVERSGDEPQMLARTLPGVPVIVCPDRHLAGTIAERRFGCTVHLLDDGYQHLQLWRDVDLLLMSKADLDERMLPSGRLREPVDAAFAADALLVAGNPDDAEEVAASVGNQTVFRLAPHFAEPVPIGPGEPAYPKSNRAIAVAAIARPQRFFAAARTAGWDVVREFPFRDHHWFDARDLAGVMAAAKETGADIILTTEKDAVRLEGMLSDAARAFTARDLPPWAYLPMTVSIEPAARFTEWLLHRLRPWRA